MKDDNLIILAAVGLGLFVFMRQRAMAAPVIMGQAPSTGSNAAQWANTIANGINALGNAFKGSSASSLGAWASSPIYKPYVAQGATTLPQAAAWLDSDPDVNGSIMDFVGGADALALNPVGAAPWDWAAGGGLYLG